MPTQQPDDSIAGGRGATDVAPPPHFFFTYGNKEGAGLPAGCARVAAPPPPPPPPPGQKVHSTKEREGTQRRFEGEEGAEESKKPEPRAADAKETNLPNASAATPAIQVRLNHDVSLHAYFASLDWILLLQAREEVRKKTMRDAEKNKNTNAPPDAAEPNPATKDGNANIGKGVLDNTTEEGSSGGADSPKPILQAPMCGMMKPPQPDYRTVTILPRPPPRDSNSSSRVSSCQASSLAPESEGCLTDGVSTPRTRAASASQGVHGGKGAGVCTIALPSRPPGRTTARVRVRNAPLKVNPSQNQTMMPEASAVIPPPAAADGGAKPTAYDDAHPLRYPPLSSSTGNAGPLLPWIRGPLSASTESPQTQAGTEGGQGGSWSSPERAPLPASPGFFMGGGIGGTGRFGLAAFSDRFGVPPSYPLPPSLPYNPSQREHRGWT